MSRERRRRERITRLTWAQRQGLVLPERPGLPLTYPCGCNPERDQRLAGEPRAGCQHEAAEYIAAGWRCPRPGPDGECDEPPF